MKFLAFLVAIPLSVSALAARADTRSKVDVIYALGEQSSVGVPLPQLPRVAPGTNSGSLPLPTAPTMASSHKDSGHHGTTHATDTLMMLLIGLGVMGSIARRRRLARKSL